MILEQIIKTTILESVMDQETTRLSRSIINDIVRLFYTDEPTSLRKKSLIYKSSFGFPVEILVSKQDIEKARVGNAAFHSNAATGKTSISVEVQVPKSRDKSALPSLVMALKQVLRHEIEHARQEERGMAYGEFGKRDWDKIPDEEVWNNPMGALNYYLRPSEVEAYTMQLYKKAKMAKLPFMEVLETWLGNLEKNFTFKSKKTVISSIRKAMMAYAKQRLPALKL